MSALKWSELPVEKFSLHVPTLQDIAKVLEKGLGKNFKQVKVNVVTCPDLTQEPFSLAATGLGPSNDAVIADIGGVDYLEKGPDRSRIYDMSKVNEILPKSDNPAFAIGPGAGPWPHFGTNCELMVNISMDNKHYKQESRVALVGENKELVLTALTNQETRGCLMANLLLTQGKECPVLEIKCSERIGEDDFVGSIRKSLLEGFPKDVIGLGGVFLLKEGSANLHVMPDFSSTPLTTPEQMNQWLHFYDVAAPMRFLSVLVSQDPGLGLRLEHSHGWGPNGGGHYHYDTTPQSVQYEGYFTTATTLLRVDRPKTQ